MDTIQPKWKLQKIVPVSRAENKHVIPLNISSSGNGEKICDEIHVGHSCPSRGKMYIM